MTSERLFKNDINVQGLLHLGKNVRRAVAISLFILLLVGLLPFAFDTNTVAAKKRQKCHFVIEQTREEFENDGCISIARTPVVGASPVNRYSLSSTPTRETYVSVPFHYQSNGYYCGPAALEMVFDYYGEDIAQREIADVARTDPSGTYSDELRRAGHFSNLSTSLGNEMSGSITGYSARKVGYAAFEQWGLTIGDLKSLIDEEAPLIVLMWWSSLKVYGHYRVVVGYDGTHIVMHDPWRRSWGGTYGGANTSMTYSTFLDLWDYSGNWALLVLPWKVGLEMPDTVIRNSTFEVNVTITYPCFSPFSTVDYPASSCNAAIELQEGLELASGETIQHSLGNIIAGNSVQTSWLVNGSRKGFYNISVAIMGIVEGSVGYPSYNYEDTIGGLCVNSLSVVNLHDLEIEKVNISEAVVVQGFPLYINVTVFNSGMFAETSNVSVYANSTIIKTEDIMLANGTFTTISFVWNTTGYVLGNYTISAHVTPVPGETDIDDNTCVDGMVRIIPQFHDIAITNITTHKTVIGQTYSLHLNVTVENLGNTLEIFNITAYANAKAIQTKNITLASESFTTINFTWDTTGWMKGNYTISANATVVQGETNTTDNTLVNGWVFVTILGDVNGDRDVDIFDIVLMAGIYGMTEKDQQFISNCDIDGDGDIDIYDVVIAAGNYGQNW